MSLSCKTKTSRPRSSFVTEPLSMRSVACATRQTTAHDGEQSAECCDRTTPSVKVLRSDARRVRRTGWCRLAKTGIHAHTNSDTRYTPRTTSTCPDTRRHQRGGGAGATVSLSAVHWRAPGSPVAAAPLIAVRSTGTQHCTRHHSTPPPPQSAF